MWFLAGAAFTPIPYKVATTAAGGTHMALVPFVLVSIPGRGARFFIVATVLRVFGAPVRRTLERNFDLAALLFLVLLVGASSCSGRREGDGRAARQARMRRE